MKKIVSILSLVATATLLHAQGVVIWSSATAGMTTNTSFSSFAGGTQTGGTAAGKTQAPAGTYIYQLFVQAYTGSLSSSATNPLANGWTVAKSSGTPITGTSQATPFNGGLVGPGAAAGVAVDGWAAPSDSGGYTSAGEMYFMYAGWSSNLGTTWSAVSSLLASGFANNAVNNAYFGVSNFGFGYSGGANSLNPQSILTANTATLQGTGPLVLYALPVPEPTTMALAGLGGLSLLLFRRRSSK